ncbi:MAG: hypothetical protein U5K77_03065 [Candidatus Saccharibacteria bacterium]|nr:hypothetical protein [Candidatus Saccharibacteria bacterium]
MNHNNPELEKVSAELSSRFAVLNEAADRTIAALERQIGPEPDQFTEQVMAVQPEYKTPDLDATSYDQYDQAALRQRIALLSQKNPITGDSEAKPSNVIEFPGNSKTDMSQESNDQSRQGIAA